MMCAILRFCDAVKSSHSENLFRKCTMNDAPVVSTPDFLGGGRPFKMQTGSNQPVGTLIYEEISPLTKPKV